MRLTPYAGLPALWCALWLAMLSSAGFAGDANRTAPGTAPRTAAIVAEDSAQIRFAAGDLEAALATQGFTIDRSAGAARLQPAGAGPRVLVLFWPASNGTGPDSLTGMRPPMQDMHPEGFSLRRLHRGDQLLLHVIYRDVAGGMYGGLELAEQIRAAGVQGVVEMDRNPYMPLRGTKFNAPLDLRTPSYSDMSDAAQANIETLWDFDFWEAYLDQLARDRYNFVSLWNLHPFPSLVRVPEFPEVALDDVWRSRARFDEDYSTRTVGIVTREMLAQREVVRRITMDEKIRFWRRVMEHARDRNIAFHVVTWNIFTYGVDGKYGITDAMDNPRTRDYFRASVRALFQTYPLLAGIGLTTGENMGDITGESAFQAKEDWVFSTYGQGLLDAARAEPQRRFRLIHRQHETRAQDIARTFRPLIGQANVEFLFSFKYAQAHVLSSTRQTFHEGFVQSLGDHRTLWTLRNDDALMFRWASPGFVREFVQNIPRPVSAGYYFGSDMWVWGREFLSLQPRNPRQLEIDRHWLHFLLWGRLGYDPTLDDARIASRVEQRFPGVNGADLLAIWQHASQVYPLVTGFHWADFDFQWYIEGCRSRPGPARTASGFHSVETFIDQPVHPGTDNVPIPRYVQAMLSGQPAAGTTPPQVAQRIDDHADAALVGVERFERAARRNAELRETLEDIRAMALLGKYYAAKIRGATALAEFRATRALPRQREAVRQLERAREYWSRYTANARARYRNPLWTNRVGLVDWEELGREVSADIRIAGAPLAAPP
jgi:hypothetical protein